MGLILLSLLVYGANIWGTSVYVLDEAKNAGCAMEMYQRGDWVVPTFNNELRTDKPPLHYFFMKVAYAVGGVTPFAARLFSVFAGVCLVAFVYLITKQSLGDAVAFWASLILIASIQLGMQFHLAVPDPYLIFFLTMGVLCFYQAEQTHKGVWYLTGYAAVSLATLAKGPVAVVFSGLMVLLFLWSQGRLSWRMLWDIKLPHGVLIFCLLVLPWYIWVGIATDGVWLEKFFLQHNVGRFTATMEGHGGFPLASFVIIVAALIPFSFFAPQAIRYAWQNRRTQPLLALCLIGVAVVGVFFAFSRTILPSYPEPAVPFFAILLASYFVHAMRTGEGGRSWLWSAGIYAVIACAIPVAGYLALQQDASLQPMAGVAGYCIILSAGGIFGVYWIYKKQRQRALTGYAVSVTVFLLIFFYIILPRMDDYNPVVQGLHHVNPRAQIVAYRKLNPAFIFALKTPIPVCKETDALQQYVTPKVGCYVLTQRRYIQELQQAVGAKVVYQGKDLFESRTTVVMEVPAAVDKTGGL